MARPPRPDTSINTAPALSQPTPVAPPTQSKPSRRPPNKAVHISWPLAAIGTLATLAGNPLAPNAPTKPQPVQQAAPAFIAPVSAGDYIAPDGRTIAELIAAHVLPDPAITPGALNPDVTPNTIQTTICVARWTATVRPPDSYTNKLKMASVPAGHQASEYELDHVRSIEDGGAPADPGNLWMMIYADPYGARVKDVLETKVKRMVCNGTLTLKEAQDALYPNWLIGFQKYVGPLPSGDDG